MPADSKPSGTGGGEGRIVLLVCGTVDADFEADEGGTGYVGWEYFSDELFSSFWGVNDGLKDPVTTSQSQSPIPPGVESTAVCGE